MDPIPVARRLAAVMIADVAGYSRLMERDETGTHVRTRSLFADVVEPAITRHDGRLLRTMGDGLLAEFPSATEAVRCAIEIQRECAERSRISPDIDPIKLRIGVNVADIMFDQSDIAGGGVNLAARLETLAAPGGICISQTLREQIHEDLGVTYLDAGVKRVKNISKPVRVIRVLIDSPSAVERLKLLSDRLPVKRLVVGVVSIAGLVWAASVLVSKPPVETPEKLTVLIGDFNSSVAGDTTGSSIATALAQQVYLALSPERHVFQVKGPATGAPSAPSGVFLARYVLEGAVTAVAGGYRVDVRLVDSQSRKSLWGDRFQLKDRSDESIDAAARRIYHGLRSEVFELEIKRIKASPPSRPDSMDLVLLAYGSRDEEDGPTQARQYLERALELDPNNVPALLGLTSFVSGPELDRLTQQAVIRDPLCADSWSVRAEVLWRIGQVQAGRDAIDRALKINPANANARNTQERFLMNDGAWAQVIRPLEDVEFEHAKSLALSQLLANQCKARLLAEQDAEEACGRWFAASGSEAALVFATAASARNRTAEQAINAGTRMKERHPTYTVAAHRKRMADSGLHSSQHIAQFDKVVVPALSKAGIPHD